jgi:hypothetical protein
VNLWLPTRERCLKSWMVLGCLAFTLTGCMEASPVAVTSEKPAQTTSTIESVKPTAVIETPAPYVYPLTGLPAEQEIKSRPFMVMVENSPAARPQSGLDQADMVYEILAEGEITRFVSVFQSHDAKVIGPVRSIRPYFVEIGDALDAVIVHAGWSQDAMDIMASRKLSHLDQVYGDDAYYWRAEDRKAPHNLYTSVDKIKQGAEARKFRKEWNGPIVPFAKDRKTVLQGQPVLHIGIPYLQGYEVSYDYDAAAGLYKRFMDGKPHHDKESGKQLTATNLLVIQSKHEILDKEGRRNVDVFGPGKGVMFQQGVAQDVTWERKGGMIRAYAGGKEVPLIPGTTWVQVVPEGTGVKME